MSIKAHLTELIESDRELSRRILLDLTAAAPQSVEAWSLLALSYLRTLEYQLVVDALEKVLALAPQDGAALGHLAFAKLAMGDNVGGREAYARNFSITSRVSAANYLGLIDHRLGNLGSAEVIYNRVLGGAPLQSDERLDANRGLMTTLRDMGRLRESDIPARALQEAYAKTPTRTSSWLAERAQTQTYFEWLVLADKGRMSALLARGLAERPGALRFPETYILPAEKSELAARAAASPGDELFIIKPANGSGGQGISVTADLSAAIDRTDVVVQRYIDRPYLVDGRKGHLRVYILITQAEPLRAYIYREGIVRFAPEPYDPRPERLADISMHVTNTALHVGHPDLIISQDPDKDDEGMIWSLTGYLAHLDRQGGDGQAVFREISELAAGLLGLMQLDGVFARWAAAAPPRAYPPKLFGLDVLIDAEGHPWLLEIQSSPAATGAPLVNRVNAALFRTVFEMTVGELGDEFDPSQDELIRREALHEMRNRGKFEPIDIL